MVRFRIAFAGYGKPGRPMVGGLVRDGWVQKVVYRADRDVFRRVFRDGLAARRLPADSPPALLAELARLLPWCDPWTLLRHTPVCVYADWRLNALVLDVWSAERLDDAGVVCETVLHALNERWSGETPWGATRSELPFTVTSAAGCRYGVRTLCVDEAVAAPAELDKSLGRLAYEGLVASVLHQPDPLAVLDRLPPLRDAGFCVGKLPWRKLRASYCPRPLYEGTEFDLDLAITGGWRFGSGGACGYGLVETR